MKKFLSFLVVLGLLASVFVYNVGTAKAASVLTLTSVHFVSGKGIVFVFDTNGALLRAPNLRGAVLYLNGNSYPLSCKVNKDQGTVVCTVRGGLSQDFAGDPGSILLFGRWYSVVIPAPPDPIPDGGNECPPYECPPDK